LFLYGETSSNYPSIRKKFFINFILNGNLNPGTSFINIAIIERI